LRSQAKEDPEHAYLMFFAQHSGIAINAASGLPVTEPLLARARRCLRDLAKIIEMNHEILRRTARRVPAL
jgi:hypothetical protein